MRRIPGLTFLDWGMYGRDSYDRSVVKLAYTWGAFAELNRKYWAVCGGYFVVPTVSKVNTFDMRISSTGEYAGELDLRYPLFSQPGKLRLFGWANRSVAGSYSEPVATPIYPDIAPTWEVRANYGFVVNDEQAITGDVVRSAFYARPGRTLPDRSSPTL